MPNDYYQTLGVNKQDSSEDIRKAFRQKAIQKWHAFLSILACLLPEGYPGIACLLPEGYAKMACLFSLARLLKKQVLT